MFESPHREEMVSFPYARLTVITGIFVPSRLAEMVYPDRANSFLAAFPAKKQLKGPSMKRRKLVFSAIAILAAAAIGGGGYQYWKNKKSTTAPQQAGGRRGRRMPTSVLTVPAKTQNVDVYVSALGTVTPAQSVSVISQVTGRLTQIFFKEGQYVKRGTLLAKVDTRGYEANTEQYRGTLAQSEAQLANARQVLSRYQKLYAQNSISKQDYDAQAALVKQYEGAVRAAKGQISGAQVSVGYGRITAPISGFIGLRGVDIGNLVGPSDSTAIATITQTRPISVEFSIPQANLSDVVTPIRAGKSLRVEVYDQSGSTQIAQSTVKTVGNSIDTTTGTVKLKADFPNTDDKLFPNQFVNVKLITNVLENAVVVPTAAVQTSTTGQFVFTVDSDSVAHRTPIKMGPDAGNGFTAILSGLKAGDPVITSGVDSATDGGKVNVVKPAAANGSDGAKPRRRKPSAAGSDAAASPAASAPASSAASHS